MFDAAGRAWRRSCSTRARPPAAGGGFPATLDGNDYYAAEFSLGASQTITAIQAYVTAGGDQPGATFTVALFADGDLGNRFATPAYSDQATYQQDGWTGLTNLNITGLTAGKYWAVLEVQEGVDLASALNLPTPGANGSVPALAYEFSADGGTTFTSSEAPPIGMQVEVAPVPLPGALLLFGSGLLGVGGIGGAARRRRAAAAVC